MVLLKAQELLDRAHKGEILTSKERRHCIDYILANSSGSNPDDSSLKGKHLVPLTNQEMADLFQVSVRQITKDKNLVKKQRAKDISDEDVTLVLADLSYIFDEQLAKAKRALNMAKPGTDIYLKYLRTIADLAVQRVKILQDLGYYPKNIGNITVDNYEFTANINPMTGKAQVSKGKDNKNVIDVTAQLIKDETFFEVTQETKEDLAG